MNADKPPPCVTCPLYEAPTGSPALAICRAYAPDWTGHVKIPPDHPGCGFHPDWPAWAKTWADRPIEPTPPPE